MNKKNKNRHRIFDINKRNAKKNVIETPKNFPKRLLPDTIKDDLQLLEIVPNSVFVAKGFLDSDECAAWINYANEVGFESICSPKTREYAQRECGRLSKVDWDMADKLYQRMRFLVEEIANVVQITSSNHPVYKPLTCNGNLRLYRYDKSMAFGKHYDDSDTISKFFGGKTELTVLIYLSTCKGGATRFYPNTRNKKKNEGVAFEPEVGSILLHVHGDRCLEHEADPVIEGVKYVLRTDIVYAPPN